jgi:nucleotide-binding universal stress UspA family protein
MKKIIAAFDGLKYSESTRDYAIDIAKLSGAHLIGVFMDDFTYSSFKVYELITNEGISESKLKKLQQQDKATRDAAAANFVTTCSHAGISFSIHHDNKIALKELNHESIYADLLIIDARETLTHYTEKLPTRFIRDLLSDVQCPVLVVPPRYIPFQRVVLLYDGEPSSVQAVKMFSYLLPKLKQLDTESITINPLNSSLHIPDNKLMKELMKRHYPDAKIKVSKGQAEEEIIKYLKPEKGNVLVVLGAYRRGTVSRWFRTSMADKLMKELKLPLFIAHN